MEDFVLSMVQQDVSCVIKIELSCVKIHISIF